MDPNHSILNLLLASAHLTCAEAYERTVSWVPEEDAFQVALEQLLPVIRGDVQVQDSRGIDFWATRCLCAYSAYRLYAPHPIALNPFRSTLEELLSTREGSSTQSSLEGRFESIFDNMLRQILDDRGAELSAISPRDVLAQCIGGGFVRLPGGPSLAPIGIDSQASKTEKRSASTDSTGLDWRGLILQAQNRVLSLSEQRKLLRAIPDISRWDLTKCVPPEAIPAFVNLNNRVALPIVKAILTDEPTGDHQSSQEDSMSSDLDLYINALACLPPTLGSVDLIGNLLKQERDGHGFKWVRDVVVELFITHCLQTIDVYEREDEDSEVDDEGRTARTIQLLSKFVLSVIRNDDPGPDAQSSGESSTSTADRPSFEPASRTSFSEGLDIELTNFALRHSRLADANTLYRTLASRYVSQ